MRYAIIMTAMLSAMGCSALKPACAVINIANYACEYVTVEYVDEDGQVRRENVSTQALRAAALEARAKKDAQEKAQDGPDLSAE